MQKILYQINIKNIKYKINKYKNIKNIKYQISGYHGLIYNMYGKL